ncbi:hemerythrin domain-containing protein [Nocardioides panzhihuensis]|uniref:Hemerythrin-like domain-containing protein n=1 Tax=Nocardioides panzhihuensis TaxID=860243 RepID=A0A7Z0DP50_9ACTN|nr:hemerythrin-like domain-containing protein [Nocardioides panzhihuensis]
MTEGEKTRLIAWADEMRRVHDRLRKALRVTQKAIDAGDPAEPAARDLLLFCHGFCEALTGHHEGEDRELFPAIDRAHPELRETIRYLEQDHSMIGYLLGGLQAAVDQAATPEDLGKHLEGISAIMESHFRYEERKLLSVLDTLTLDAEVGEVFGPL